MKVNILYLRFNLTVFMKRDKVIESIKELPQEFELETLIERLIFIEKVEQGLKQIDEGKTISHEQVVEIAKKW